MIKKKIRIFYVFCIICAVILIMFYLQTRKFDSLTIFKNKIKNINYVMIQNFSSIKTIDDLETFDRKVLSKEDIMELKKIILEKINKNKYFTDGNYSDNMVPVDFFIKLDNESLIIDYYKDEQVLFFYFYWFMPNSITEEKIKKAVKTEIYMNAGEEIIQLLKKYDIE